ncbi:MAG: elongation factor P maturation arginine rhamnosyltransferase EarP [Betaproteobacteria bacterium]
MSGPRDHVRRWDIFCRVVDNYGDAGVAWRLARQLAREHALAVALYIDDRAALMRIAPSGERGVEVRDWRGPDGPWSVDPDCASVVIEAFGCGLPSAYLDAMQARSVQPRWINLEYLSAEAWVDEHHALASAQAHRALTRHFYFPGFTPASGGLLRERALFAERDAFAADTPQAAASRTALWRALDVETPSRDAMAVSMFCYDNAGLPPLLSTWADASLPIVCILPEGVGEARIDAWAGVPTGAAGTSVERGSLRLSRARFVTQDAYDRLLWACHLNFVRGEDSFVRAQWAARPLVWNVYPQDGQAHLRKLEAFAGRYAAALPAAASEAYAAFCAAWNGNDEVAAARAWPELVSVLPLLQRQALSWSAHLGVQRDLASALVNFASTVV